MTTILEKLKTEKRTHARLSDFIKIKHGYAFKGEYFGDKGSHVVVTPGNFFEEGGFRRRENKDKWYSGSIPEGYILDKGDVVIAMTEQGEGLLGSSAIIPTGDLFLHNQRIGLVEIKDEKAVDRVFLYNLFNSRRMRSYIQASASGTKVRHTAPDRITSYEYDFPSLPMQKKIAEILSAYDEKIENNKLLINKLEMMAETIFDEWFVKFHFPGYEKSKTTYSNGIEIPEGWLVFSMRDLFTFVKGKKPSQTYTTPTEGLLPQILIDSFESGMSDFADPEGMVVADESDLLMVMDGASSGRTELGVKGIVGSTMSKLELKKNVKTILFYFLKSKQKDIQDNATGSAIPHTDKEKVYRYTIALPEDCTYLDAQLNVFTDQIRMIRKENILLKEARESLLANLI